MPVANAQLRAVVSACSTISSRRRRFGEKYWNGSAHQTCCRARHLAAGAPDTTLTREAKASAQRLRAKQLAHDQFAIGREKARSAASRLLAIARNAHNSTSPSRRSSLHIKPRGTLAALESKYRGNEVGEGHDAFCHRDISRAQPPSASRARRLPRDHKDSPGSSNVKGIVVTKGPEPATGVGICVLASQERTKPRRDYMRDSI